LGGAVEVVSGNKKGKRQDYPVEREAVGLKVSPLRRVGKTIKKEGRMQWGRGKTKKPYIKSKKE